MYTLLPPDDKIVMQSGLSLQLIHDQTIINLGQRDIDANFVNERLPFIGTVQNSEISSMGCLLEDGTFLTVMHSLYDFEAAQSYNLQNMRVFFVKGRDVFSYAIKQILHDGWEAYTNNAPTYDYALLELDGDPIKDLGVGLKLDSTNHFGSAFITDPSKTLAISAPCFSKNDTGQLIVTRYCSIAENEAARGNFYMFPQMGHHPARSGMSGQGIFSSDGSLYAIHVGIDHQAQSRFGFKISEYLSSVKFSRQNSSVSRSGNRSAFTFLPLIEQERNKNSQRRQENIEEGNARLAAIERTNTRMTKYSNSAYKVMNTRSLANYFPQLGPGIFNFSTTSHTNTNKTEFYNPATGWCLCYDKHGQYNTVINERGHHVALDGTTSPDGKDAKYHFYNTARERDFGPSLG